jgi:hypothetical protein
MIAPFVIVKSPDWKGDAYSFNREGHNIYRVNFTQTVSEPKGRKPLAATRMGEVATGVSENGAGMGNRNRPNRLAEIVFCVDSL